MGRTLISLVLVSIASYRLAIGQVVINEVLYDSEPDSKPLEFIELYNPGALTVDLSGWRFDEGIDFIFTNGTSIAASNFLVIAQDPIALQAEYGVSAMGPWAGSLRNRGEQITLRDAGGHVIDEVDYGRAFPWPTCPGGASMELIHPSFDNDIAGSWRSSLNPITVTQQTFLASAQSDWRYFKGLEEASSPVDAWRFATFSESTNWLTGQTPIGYGDSDDNTTLSDMRNQYSTVYLRNKVVMPEPVPDQVLVRVYVDDGAIVWINGTEIGRSFVSSGNKAFNDTGNNHEAAWEEILVNNAPSVFTSGTNQVAVHALNQAVSSSDFSIDLEIKTAPPGGSNFPTPGEINRGFAVNAPPAIRQVKHFPKQPVGGEPVRISAKVTDPDGVQSVTLEYKVIGPGVYERLNDISYEMNWVSTNLVDDGTAGDEVAADDVFSVLLPGSLQEHRHLVRYRITIEDGVGLSQRVPYIDDEQPNFAYFVYDGVPAWTGADNPGTTATTNFPASLMSEDVPVYHLIAQESDVLNCQYNSSFRNVRLPGALVYDGIVYDHIAYKVRGEASTYRSGKNKWRFYFNAGRGFEARDNFGNKYPEPLNRINVNGCASPWSPVNRGMAGLDEAVSFKMYELAGVTAPNTHLFQLRVIDRLEEAPVDQYAGDLWGLYIMQEHLDSRWLGRLGLPDGNTYKIQNNNGEKRNQGVNQSEDDSDWRTFLSSAQNAGTAQSWWENNLHLHNYFGFRAINRVVSNIDLRDQTNYGMYHHPDGLWRVIPQDMDMMFHPETHWSGTSHMKNCLVHSDISIAFKNRARELMDLLCDDTSPAGGQIGQVLDEFARLVNPSGQALTIADVDRYMWNYHPRTASDHRGRFYVTPFNDSRRGGSWVRTLNSADHEGYVQYILDFMSDTDPDGFAVGDGDQRGYGFNYLELEAADVDIPDRPSIVYSGPANFPVDDLRFSSSAFSDATGTFGAMEWRLGEIYNSSSSGYEEGEPFKYEVTPFWGATSTDPSIATITVPPVEIIVGRMYRARVRHMDNTGRWSRWSSAAEFIAGPAQSVSAYDDLVISEIHYHPADFEDFAFLEFFNQGQNPIDLSGVSISSAVDFLFTNSLSIAPGEYVVVVENESQFDARYRDQSSPYYYPGIVVAGTFSGQLANDGEEIVMCAPGGLELFRVDYEDGGNWPDRPDGRGSSLELILPAPSSTNRTGYLQSGDVWSASCAYHGTPGRGRNCAETLSINEVLSHSDAAPGLDWVELVNTNDTSVNTIGMFLSDTYNNLEQFALTAPVAGGAFVVFDELDLGFGFSELGDDVVLTQIATNGAITFLDTVGMDASARDRTFGIHERSDGQTDFTAQRVKTEGGANAYPLVGPMVFTEIMYHPTNGVEYVELLNISREPVDLSQWRLTSAINYTFPSNTVVPAKGLVLVSSTNDVGFRVLHDIDSSVQVFGPFEGLLNNAGESLRLRRPGDIEPDGFIPYILMDKVDYRSVGSWPVAADGTGPGLERITAYVYGNDPASWQPGFSPGVFNAPEEHLLIAPPELNGGQLRIIWSTLPGESYRIEFCNDLDAANWVPIQSMVAGATVWEIIESTVERRHGYYRLIWEP